MGQPPRQSRTRHQAAFTMVEVMMASVILVVGFMGMIQAVTIGSEMLATARRQTIAAQILDHEIEKLRYADWTTVSSYPTGPTTLTIDTQFRKAWSSATAYAIGDVVASSGTWYYCITAHTNQAVTNTTYWRQALASEAGVMTDTNIAHGATFALSRTVASVSGATNLREITFTVTWTVVPSGFSTSRTYTRMRSAYSGKFGLNQSIQRS
jgi:Tfp pilus assembly protein PilV